MDKKTKKQERNTSMHVNTRGTKQKQHGVAIEFALVKFTSFSSFIQVNWFLFSYFWFFMQFRIKSNFCEQNKLSKIRNTFPLRWHFLRFAWNLEVKEPGPKNYQQYLSRSSRTLSETHFSETTVYSYCSLVQAQTKILRFVFINTTSKHSRPLVDAFDKCQEMYPFDHFTFRHFTRRKINLARSEEK